MFVAVAEFVLQPTVVIVINKLKDAIADLRRSQSDFTPLELDFMKNLCQRNMIIIQGF